MVGGRSGGHGGHGGHGGGHHHIAAGEAENFDAIFFALPHRDELSRINSADQTTLQKMVQETLDSGADMNGDGQIGMVELLDYLRLRAFSKQKEVTLLAKYECGSLVPALDVLMDQTRRQGDGVKQAEQSHLLACRTEAIVYVCGNDIVQKFCTIIPGFEDFLWKKAALLGMKRFGENKDAKTLPFEILNELVVHKSYVIRRQELTLEENQHAVLYVHDAKLVNGSPWANNWDYVMGPLTIPLQTRPNDRAVVFTVKSQMTDLFRTSPKRKSMPYRTMTISKQHVKN